MKNPLRQIHRGSGRIRGKLTTAAQFSAALVPGVCLGLVLTLSAPAGASPTQGAAESTTQTPQSALDTRVAELTERVTALGGKLGLSVVVIRSGAVLAQVNPRLPLNPASNMKLLTAAVLLDRLGPGYRFATGLYGSRQGSEVRELVLRGRGDPSFRTPDLLRLALALYKSGVTRVGSILVDQSYFDAQFVPPAFDEQPNEWAPFRAPVSAVSLDQNTVRLNVIPGQPGAAAHVWFDPEDVFPLSGQVTTSPAGSGQHIGWTLRPQPNGQLAELGGSVAADLSRQRFTKRLHDPRLVPGQTLKKLLERLGVEVGDRVTEGGSEVKERIVYHESQPLGSLLANLGKDSDNFYAETLLKVLGAEQDTPPGTSAAGGRAILEWITQHNALVPGTRIVNGSGLFNADRVSAWTLSTTLRAAFLDPRLQPEYVAQLSIAGVDGTLRSRLKQLAGTRSIRAKTGTLNSTVALSGYALGSTQDGPLAFSMIVDGVSGHHTEMRQRFDAIALELAKLATAPAASSQP